MPIEIVIGAGTVFLAERLMQFFNQRKQFKQSQSLQRELETLRQKEREYDRALRERQHEDGFRLQRLRLEREQEYHRENLALHRERIEKEHQLQCELEQMRAKLNAQLAAYSRETALRQVRETERYRNFPLRSTVENILDHQTQPERLVVLMSPYRIDSGLNKNVVAPEIERTLAENIHHFLEQQYDMDHQRVWFLDGAWKDKSYRGEAAALEIFGLLHSEPVLILESDIEIEKLTLRAWFWGRNWKRYNSLSLLSSISHLEILHRIAERHAWEWKREYEERIASLSLDARKDTSLLDEIRRSRPEDTHNLAELERRDQTHGAYTPSFKRNNRHWDELRDILTAWHCFAIGALTDSYFLAQYDYLPTLPLVFPGILRRIRDVTAQSELTNQFLGYCQNILNTYGQERPSRLPHLELEMANALTKLPDPSIALSFAMDSINTWLREMPVIEQNIPTPTLVQSNIVIQNSTWHLIQELDPEYAKRLGLFHLCEIGYDNARKESVEEVTMDHTADAGNDFGSNEKSLIESFVNVFQEFRIKMEKRVEDPSLHFTCIEHENEVRIAYDLLIKALKKPKIVIAVTGGTNSGKSTLVNLLVGAGVAPVAFREMSAGLISIRKGVRRKFIVHDTPDENKPRLWEVGDYFDLEDEDIQQRLKDIMLIYNEVRNEHRDHQEKQQIGMCLQPPSKKLPSPPRITTELPEALDRFRMDDLGLPEGAEIELIDLPGVTDPGDKENLGLTQEIAASNGICLVVCDASVFTGRNALDNVIEEAVNSLKRLASSTHLPQLAPRRILFILNKVDIPVLNGTSFEEATKLFSKQIKNKIKRELPEITEQWLEQFEFISMSGGIAQFQDKLRRNCSQKRVAHLRDQQNRCFIQDDSIMELLDEFGWLKKANTWTEEQWQQVIDKVGEIQWKFQSKDLFDFLKHHIVRHFPILVLPQLINPIIHGAARRACIWATETVHTKKMKTQKEFEIRIKQLEDLRADISHLHKKQFEKLEPIIAFSRYIIENEITLKEQLQSLVGQHEKVNKLISEMIHSSTMKAHEVQVDFIPSSPDKPPLLIPFVSWMQNVNKDIHSFMEAILQAIVEHSAKLNESSSVKEHISNETRLKISYAIEDLVNAGYRNMQPSRDSLISAILGSKHESETVDTQDLNCAEKIRSGLTKLQLIVQNALVELVESRFELEKTRIISLANELIMEYSRDLSAQVTELAHKNNLDYLTFALDVPVSPIPTDIDINFELEGKSVETIKKTRLETREYERMDRAISFWGRLVGRVKDFFSQATEEVTIQYKVAKIPTARLLVSSWQNGCRRLFVEVGVKIGDWFAKQIEHSTQMVQLAQEEVVDRNLQAIENERKKTIFQHEKEIAFWESASNTVKDMEHYLTKADKRLKSYLVDTPTQQDTINLTNV